MILILLEKLSGLGLTNINIVPHYNSNKDLILGNKRFYEDIIYSDSFKFCIYVLVDGAYIYVDKNNINVYGECYIFHKGVFNKICSNGMNIRLS